MMAAVTTSFGIGQRKPSTVSANSYGPAWNLPLKTTPRFQKAAALKRWMICCDPPIKPAPMSLTLAIGLGGKQGQRLEMSISENTHNHPRLDDPDQQLSVSFVISSHCSLSTLATRRSQ